MTRFTYDKIKRKSSIPSPVRKSIETILDVKPTSRVEFQMTENIQIKATFYDMEDNMYFALEFNVLDIEKFIDENLGL